jgi:predicted nucleic acid-binding protein
MIYLDTSFIAPRYIAEATSEKVEQFLLQLHKSLHNML